MMNLKNDISVILYLEETVKTIDAKITELQKQKDNYKKNLELSKLNLRLDMGNEGVKQLQTDEFKVSIRKNTSVKILDENKVPTKYKTIHQVEKIDKRKIRKDLKNNTVEGVEIEVKENIQIKEV